MVARVLPLISLGLQLPTVAAVPEDQEITTALQQQAAAQEMEHVLVQQIPVVAEQIAHRHLLAELAAALVEAEL
jgi:hypothetical protein